MQHRVCTLENSSLLMLLSMINEAAKKAKTVQENLQSFVEQRGTSRTLF